MKKKILATTYDSGAAKAMYSIIKSLGQLSDLEVITIIEGPAQNIFTSKGTRYVTLSSYDLKEDFYSAMHIFDKEKPDLVFTGISEFYNMERYFLHLARINKIPSISIIEGSDYTSIRLKDSKIDPNFRFNPDYLLAVDEFTFDSMLREGFENNRLILTGHPGYDEMLILKRNFNLEDLLKTRQDLGIKNDSYLVMFLSQPRFNSIKINPEEDNGYNELTVISDLEDALSNLNIDNLSLFIKIHPREDLNLTRTALKGRLKNVFIDKDYDTQRAILASNLITGMFSLSLIESVYLDRDTISLQPGLNKEDRLITNKLGLTVPVYKKEDIIPTLKKVIYDKDFKKQLEERRGKLKLDGKSTERVVNFICKTLNI